MEKQLLLDAYESMKLIRTFDMTLHQHTESRDHVLMGIQHSHAGAEAWVTAVMKNLKLRDYIASTYRNHAHSLARGVKPRELAAELCGKKTGVCGGMSGSMHAVDQNLNMIAGFGIIAAGLPAAGGTAFASNYRGTDEVSAVFFGDGAIPQGAFHESLNLASLWKLPVLYCNDNNGYAMSTSSANNLVHKSTTEYAKAYNIPSVSVDGMDFFESYEAVKKGVDYIRSGNGPYFIEFVNYRFHGQWEGDPQLYKPKEEVEEHWKNEPIGKFEKHVLEEKWLTEEDLKKVSQKVDQIVIEAFEFAKNSDLPDMNEIFTHVYADKY